MAEPSQPPQSKFSLQAEADAILLRPAWCPAPQHCMPVASKRDVGKVEMCFGVSRGVVFSADASGKAYYARQCWKHRAAGPISLGLDLVDALFVMESLAKAIRAQAEVMFPEIEEKGDATQTQA